MALGLRARLLTCLAARALLLLTILLNNRPAVETRRSGPADPGPDERPRGWTGRGREALAATNGVVPGMKLSVKADYAVRALLDLAERYGEGPTPCHEIAARERIPGPFLDQLLMSLRRAGLVQSTRGPRGGHALASPPEQVSLAAVVDALEGGGEGSASGASDEPPHAAALREVLGRADAAARAVLEETTLAQVLQNSRGERVFHGIYRLAPRETGSP